MKKAGNVVKIEGGMNAFKIVRGEPIGQKPLGRSKSGWENIRIDLK